MKLKEVYKYIVSDYTRYWGKPKNSIVVFFRALSGIWPGFTYSFWMRLCYSGGVIFGLARFMLLHYSHKYHISIPYNTKIGYGLYLGHGFDVVINPNTVIGNNVNLSQFVNIGSNSNKGAIIGDRVYIAPHTCIVEGVHIGEAACIGAGSVVVKDVPCSVTYAGNPAKQISFNNANRFINNQYIIEG